MKRELQIIGAGGGGKGGGGGGGISEDPDTLSSVAYARVIELLAEGPIKGLVNGEYSIYLDGVPLRDSAGTPNYKPFKWAFTQGTQSQPPIAGFAGTQSETTVAVPLRVSTGRIIRTITDADADSVRVTVSVNGLTKTTSKGKIEGSTVEYTIAVRRQGSPTWTRDYQQVIKGKTGSRYQQSTEVELTGLGVGPYEVSVLRTTADSTSALLIDDLNWDSYTTINYEQFSYPNSALVALELDARYFSQVPVRSYHVQGLLIRIPSNYNPVTRRYTGNWDGNFQVAYSNNPAWCFFDLLTSDRYGLGKRISDAQANKWLMYQIGKYCDELVPTGLTTNVYDVTGGTSFSAQGRFNAGPPKNTGPLEPRFTLNCVINTREDAYKVINYLSSVFRGMTYWSGGMVAVTQDSPANPEIIWNNANVIDGIFHYEGSSRTQRHTTCTVAWNDPTEDYKQKFEYVEDREGIARYGVRPTDVVGFGCTSKAQAHRQALYILLTEKLEQQIIKFTVGLDSAEVVPGLIGQIFDYKRAGTRWGGRITGHTNITVTLDSPVTLNAGTYSLSVMSIEGTVITRSVIIATGGTFTGLTVSVAFTVAPVSMAVWTLASTTITPILGRVISVKQQSASTFEISCIAHDPSKYSAIDYGTPLIPQTYSTLTYDGAPDIANLRVIEVTYKTVDTAKTISSLDISWDISSNPLVRGYKLVIKTSSGTVIKEDEVNKASFTLENVVPDTYVVTVSSISNFAVLGVPTTVTTTVTGVDRTRPINVTGLTGTPTNGTIVLTWDKPADLDYSSTILQQGTTWSDATPSLYDGRSNTFTWPWPGPGTYTVLAKHKDTSGNVSLTAASVTVTLSPSSSPGFLSVPPNLTNFTTAGTFKAVFLSWDMNPYPNHSYVEVRRSTTDSFGTSTTIGTSSSDMYVDTSASGSTTYYYWIRAVGYLADGTPIYGAYNPTGTGGTSGGALLIGNVDLGPLIVEAANLASGAVTAGKLAANSIAVGTAAIQNAAIVNAMMANSSIDTANIINLAVATAKIADLAVTTAKIANLAVGNAQIANLSVDNAKIANLAVETAKIANLAVTTAKIGNAQVDSLQIAGYAVVVPSSAQVTANKDATYVSNVTSRSKNVTLITVVTGSTTNGELVLFLSPLQIPSGEIPTIAQAITGLQSAPTSTTAIVSVKRNASTISSQSDAETNGSGLFANVSFTNMIIRDTGLSPNTTYTYTLEAATTSVSNCRHQIIINALNVVALEVKR
jgi:predicted phage tail protein